MRGLVSGIKQLRQHVARNQYLSDMLPDLDDLEKQSIQVSKQWDVANQHIPKVKKQIEDMMVSPRIKSQLTEAVLSECETHFWLKLPVLGQTILYGIAILLIIKILHFLKNHRLGFSWKDLLPLALIMVLLLLASLVGYCAMVFYTCLYVNVPKQIHDLTGTIQLQDTQSAFQKVEGSLTCLKEKVELNICNTYDKKGKLQDEKKRINANHRQKRKQVNIINDKVRSIERDLEYIYDRITSLTESIQYQKEKATEQEGRGFLSILGATGAIVFGAATGGIPLAAGIIGGGILGMYGGAELSSASENRQNIIHFERNVDSLELNLIKTLEEKN